MNPANCKIKVGVLSFFFLLMAGACSNEKHPPRSMEEKIDSLINLMTLEEKVSMIHANSSFTSGGVERLGIPELVTSDGPHGVRKEHGRDWVPDEGVDDSITYLPVGVTLSSTWNPELGYAYGKVLGSEANARGKDVILGPGVNIIRTPLNGRNFEYLSEDPYLISQMVVGYVKGVQDEGVAACVKHYIANNQETERNTIDVEMSERALREIYLPGFKAAVTEGDAYTLMGAYNKFRGQFCTHSKYLINDVLKGELNFQGAVISDWGAVQNTMEALENGTDLEMGTDLAMLPNPDYSKFYMADTVISLVKSGAIKESVLDDKVRRILRVMYKIGKFGDRKKGVTNTKEHQQVALQVAEEGIVLLKNNDILPLSKAKIKSIAVIGANADRKQAGGGGSSQVNAKYEVTPLEGLKNLVGNDVQVTYSEGYKIEKNKKADPRLIQEAVKAAKDADAVLYVGGWIHGYSDGWNDNAYDAEGQDKTDLTLPFGQDELLQAVIKANPNTIVVMVGGGPVDMTAWVNQSRAIVQYWYPGMEGGNALARILFGDVNPSGKLPMTFPKKLEDCPAQVLGEYPGANGKEQYKDDIYVGYRYYDTKNVTPQFCFGHGLSYTTFEYGELTVTPSAKEATVKLSVKNTGERAGAEVVQIYVKDEKSSVERPSKELKAFKKVFLNPGESKDIEIVLKENAFMFYDEGKKQWVLEPGTFTIMAGSSSGDIRKTAELEL